MCSKIASQSSPHDPEYPLRIVPHTWDLGDPRERAFAKGFLRTLREAGHIDDAASERASKIHIETGHRIDMIVTELALISSDALLSFLVGYCGVPRLSLSPAPSDLKVDLDLDAGYFVQSGTVPLFADSLGLHVATSDVFDRDVLTSIAFATGQVVVPHLGTIAEVRELTERYLGPLSKPQTVDVDTATVGSAEHVAADDIQRLRDVASEAPIIRLVNRLIVSAVSQRASDIHLEPIGDGLRVRFRIDGLLTDVERLPPDQQAAVATRVKILARLNIAERRLPQDGRIRMVVAGRELDLRVSTTPVAHGEGIVLRILNQQEVQLSFDALGFEQEITRRLEQLISTPHGLLLVTGPTGSGKTTSLYTMLKALNTIERKVFTIEDPIEYQLPGINQIQTKPAIGLDFAHGLRSVLRQDPDIVMIGEMRDLETARTGMRASLTGHLVLSTLHTNSAASAITRLLDMGIEQFLLTASLLGVLAQRLVRRLCPNCSQPAEATDTLRGFVAQMNNGPGISFDMVREPVGCAQCRGTGYLNRTALTELLIVSPEVRELIRSGASESDLESAARQAGMTTLFDCGLRKVLAGETTLEELLRVAVH